MCVLMFQGEGNEWRKGRVLVLKPGGIAWKKGCVLAFRRDCADRGTRFILFRVKERVLVFREQKLSEKGLCFVVYWGEGNV